MVLTVGSTDARHAFVSSHKVRSKEINPNRVEDPWKRSETQDPNCTV
jgi:hypothetical protein